MTNYFSQINKYLIKINKKEVNTIAVSETAPYPLYYIYIYI